MKKGLQNIYKYWTLLWFVMVFFLIFPFFVLFAQKESWKKNGHFLNKLWAHIVFAACMLPTKVEKRFRYQRGRSYIYCANHSSYLDIPSLAYALPGYFLFVGKASLLRVPMFGYMFRKYYIAVNRESVKSRYETVIQSFAAIEKKRSVAIFPEGTIPKNDNPQLISFKDGPFRIAIEKQIPIVPVTIPYNWIILPDDGKFVPKRYLMKVVVHEAIETKGMTLDDVEKLKQQTYQVIHQELEKHKVLGHANR